MRNCQYLDHAWCMRPDGKREGEPLNSADLNRRKKFGFFRARIRSAFPFLPPLLLPFYAPDRRRAFFLPSFFFSVFFFLFTRKFTRIEPRRRWSVVRLCSAAFSPDRPCTPVSDQPRMNKSISMYFCIANRVIVRITSHPLRPRYFINQHSLALISYRSPDIFIYNCTCVIIILFFFPSSLFTPANSEKQS